MSNVGAVGIDFGSLHTCIAVAKRGGVEIIANEGSHRETQNIVGFGQNERFIGEQGYIQFKSNCKNTVHYFSRFLDVKSSTPYLAHEKKFLTTNLAEIDGKLAFEVMFMGEKKRFLPEQIAAMMIQKLKQIIEKAGVSAKEIVLSVPGYFTEKERHALLDAAKIAEVNVLRLFNEESAVALGYGIFRRNELDATIARNVIFVDLGHAKCSTYVASFTKEKLKVLSIVHERNFGARDLDWCILEFLAKKFNEQHGLSFMKNDKAKLRLLESIEKGRKVLSANSEANIGVEYLVEDEDLNYNLTRVDFEKIIAPELERFRAVLNKLNEEIANKKLAIHSVELVGGASRIPIIQKIIEETFQKECSRTLNMSECIARGCAMQAAMISPLFKVATYDVEEANYYPVKCSWLFFDPESERKKNDAMEIEDSIKNQLEKQTATLFDKGCSIPNVKSLTFNRDDAIKFTLFYDPVPNGTDEILGDYKIYPIKPKEKDFHIKLRVKLNHHGTVSLEEASFVEEYMEEYQVPIPIVKVEENKDKANASPTDPTLNNQDSPVEKTANANPEPQKQLFETKTRKKTRTTDLKYENVLIKGFNEKEMANLFEQEAHMNNHDTMVRDTHDKKNALESYIYDLRQKLADKYKEYAPPQSIENIIKKLGENENWLYNEGASAAKGQYMTKLEELKKVGDPIIKRFFEYAHLPDILNELLQTRLQYEQFVANTNVDI